MRGDTDAINDAPRLQFFNATKQTFKDKGALAPIVWRAFPRNVLKARPTDEARWQTSDSTRSVQDEYCEWSVTRDAASGKITKVTFTCEGPEYWTYLAATQPDTVVELYRKHVDAAVLKEDLFTPKYNPQNKWNNGTRTGAMHLIMRANTLNAEVELAAGASVVRPDGQGGFMEDQSDLIACSQYGDPGRFSDPSIGAAVNALARKGAMISLANPIGIYFDSFQPVGFNTPDNTSAMEFWTWTRGEEGRWLRGVFEVPAGKGYVVGDIEIQGKGKIRYGGMIADYIRMKLTGLAYDISPANIKLAAGCKQASRDFKFDVHTAAAKDAPPPRTTRLSRDVVNSSSSAPTATGQAQQVLRFIQGLDSVPVPLPNAEAAALLQDPFAHLILLSKSPKLRPTTMDALAKTIAAGSPQNTKFETFLVGDGSQFKKIPDLERHFRFIWTRNVANASTVGNSSSAATDMSDIQPVLSDILITTATVTDSQELFLQVATWDNVNQVFNFYSRMRDPRQPSQVIWTWVGSSLHAFVDGSRGKGPFDGHVNGALVMKELRFPWNNWHSSRASINVPDEDPLSQNPFFIDRAFADDLQHKIEQGITAWTFSRVEKALKKPEIQQADLLLQHLFKTTTVNLTSSDTRSQQLRLPNKQPEPVILPFSFFLNSGALGLVLALDDLSESMFKVPFREVYEPVLKTFDVHLEGNTRDGKPVRIEGDTYFAFLVPEAAQEDIEVVKALLASGVASRRFVLASLMVDFCNPIYSPRRLALMQHVPKTGNVKGLEPQIVGSIRKAAEDKSNAALEFVKFYDHTGSDDDVAKEAAAAIKDYLIKADALCQSQVGFSQLLKLAHYRRRAYAGFNTPLDEFPLTLPRTNIPDNARPLKMQPDGTIVEMALDSVNVQAFLESQTGKAHMQCGAEMGGVCPVMHAARQTE